MNDRNPEIEAEIFIADGDRILLFMYKAGGPKTQDNLVRMRADGGLVWKAEPPEPSAGDSWVAVEMVPDEGLVSELVELLAGAPRPCNWSADRQGVH